MRPDFPEFRQTIFSYLEAQEYFERSTYLRGFIQFLKNGNLKEWHFAGCLAIDIRHNLADISEYARLIEDFMHSERAPSLEKLHKFIISHYPEQNLFSTQMHVFSQERFVRVIRKETVHKHFKTYYGDPTRDSDELEMELEGRKLTTSEVSGAKMIVWLTKYVDLERLIRDTPAEAQADRVCDWLGIPRDEASTGGGSPHEDEGKDVMVYLKYPDKLALECFQPIAANGNWECAMPLFMSYRHIDGWGRTFNHRDQQEAAKEVIHKHRRHSEGFFMAGVLGKVHQAPIDTGGILAELLARFE